MPDFPVYSTGSNGCLQNKAMSWCQPLAPCLLWSAPCPISPHISSTLRARWSKPYLAQGASHVVFSALLLCLWLKRPARRLGTEIWGATNLPPGEAGQGGGLWLRRHLCPQSYTCDLAHHISCCSLPAPTARAARPCRQHKTCVLGSRLWGQPGHPRRSWVCAALPRCSIAETTAESHHS